MADQEQPGLGKGGLGQKPLGTFGEALRPGTSASAPDVPGPAPGRSGEREGTSLLEVAGAAGRTRTGQWGRAARIPDVWPAELVQ